MGTGRQAYWPRIEARGPDDLAAPMSATAPAGLSDFVDAVAGAGTPGFLELRAIRRGDLARRMFVAPGDVAAVRAFIAANAGLDLYFGVAARISSVNGTANNCGALSVLFVDVDRDRKALDAFPLPPSIVVTSGQGQHAYWLLQQALDLQTGLSRARGVLRRLALAVGGDTVAAEPARVLRLPGTSNFKYTPPRSVDIEVFELTRRYTLDALERVLPAAESPAPSGSPGPTIPTALPEGQRNSKLWAFGRQLRAKGLDADEITAALRVVNETRGVPPLGVDEVATLVANIMKEPNRPDFQQSSKAPVTGAAVWAAAEPAPDFIARVDVEVPWYEPRLAAPGTLTAIFSPRGVGKTHVVDAIAVKLALGGRRIMKIDRDNPRREMKRRLAAWGGANTPSYTIIAREKAPPLTDAAAWAAFPYADHDVVILDSIDATTEGVGEKDSAKPSKALAPLLDLAHREGGPAVIILGNTVRTGAHSRGSGVIEDRCDIVYEVRDVTDFRPTGAKPWWEELPPADAGAWAQRASRRKRRERYLLAFIASKFRVGEEPDPFIFEITLPEGGSWTLREVTVEVMAAGEAAQKAAEQARRDRLQRAAAALAALVRERAATGTPMLADKDAIPFLMAPEQGLTRDPARRLLADGEGRWWRTVVQTDQKGQPRQLFPPEPPPAAGVVNV